MADPMRIRANVDANGITEVKVLMNHEMETGQRKDAQGKTIPAWFIQNVSATHNGKTVLAAQGGRERRQGPDHLDRQSRRQAHRRGDDRLTALSRGSALPTERKDQVNAHGIGGAGGARA